MRRFHSAQRVGPKTLRSSVERRSRRPGEAQVLRRRSGPCPSRDKAALHWWVQKVGLLEIRDEDFGPEMTGDEILAWLEENLIGGKH
jgi:hypothetical protein